MEVLKQTDFRFEGQKSVYHGKVRDGFDNDRRDGAAAPGGFAEAKGLPVDGRCFFDKML